MEHMDMITKLHEKAGISYEEAREVLERSGWDMLDALSLLEKEGKIKPLTSSMSTVNDNSHYEEVKATASSDKEKFRSTANEIADKLKELFLKLMNNHFIVKRKNKEMLSIPVLFAIIIAVGMFGWTAAGLILGFFLDCSYSIEERK